MPFQLIWEYEEVLEMVDSKSPWYYLSKTPPGSMIWKLHAWEKSITKFFFVNLALCYKLVMILMNSAKLYKKNFFCKWISSGMFFSNHWPWGCFRKIIPRAFRINHLQYLFIFPNELKQHLKTHQISKKNIGKPSLEAVLAKFNKWNWWTKSPRTAPL